MSDLAEIREFAQRYAGAWCSRNPESVAAFFAENGSLSVNDGRPAVGRAAIAEVARGFKRDFPDMIVTMDKLTLEARDGGRRSYASPARTDAVFHWTLTGTNIGRAVRGNVFESAATNFGILTRTGSSDNPKGISTAPSTNASCMAE